MATSLIDWDFKIAGRVSSPYRAYYGDMLQDQSLEVRLRFAIAFFGDSGLLGAKSLVS